MKTAEFQFPTEHQDSDCWNRHWNYSGQSKWKSGKNGLDSACFHLVCQTPTNHIQKTCNSRSPLLPWSTHCSLALSLVIIFFYTVQAQRIHVNVASGFIQYLHTFCGRFIKIQEDGSQGQHVQAWASLFYRFAFNVIILKDGFQYPVINFQKTISLENKN